MKKQGRSEPLKSLEILVGKLAEVNNIDPRKAIHVFRLIYDETPRGGLSDEDLESMTGYRQGEIRRILRMLESYGLATHKRRRHPEKDVSRYFWRVDADTINVVLLTKKKQVLQRLKERLAFEEANQFYYCPEDGSRFTSEEALLNNYQCPRCGAPLLEEDRSNGVAKLREKIRLLEEEIARDEKRIYSS